MSPSAKRAKGIMAYHITGGTMAVVPKTVGARLSHDGRGKSKVIK